MTLAAEMVYEKPICEGRAFGPGWRAGGTWKPHKDSERSWEIKMEVLANAVWRRGRLFLRCPHCERRAARLYVPVVNLEPRCRRCWGLSYESQAWSYKATGYLRFLGSVAYVTTSVRREQRQLSARERYAARRGRL